ncbi:MAG: hypothetical protein HQL93_13000 [Magnetococcales bacterium]|nr:hypothetical protein [Magnetococcales bacterium]
MLRLNLANFIRIKNAEIKIFKGITLLAGDNETGKSSLARAAAACATGTIIPIIYPSGKDAIPKGETKNLVHRGEKKGSATMAMAEEQITLTWPSNAIKGKPPITTSMLSAGLVEWMGILPDARRKLLSAAMIAGGLSVEPTLDDLTTAMAAEGVGDQQYVDYVWGLIQMKGWDGSLQEIGGKWSEVTGIWRATTGEAYGTEKAKDWFPSGWMPDLKKTSEDDLNTAIDDAKAALEDGIARRAVGGANVAALRIEAEKPIIDVAADEAKLADLTAELNKLKMSDPTPESVIPIKKRISGIDDDLSKINRKVAKLIESRTVLPIIPRLPGETNRTHVCPVCAAGLYVVSKGGMLNVDAETRTTPKIMQEANEAIADAKARAERCKDINCGLDKEKEQLVIQTNELLKELKELGEERDEILKEARFIAQDQIQKLATEISELKAAILLTQQVNKSIHDAAEQIKKIGPNANGGNMVTDEDITKLRTDVDHNTSRLAAFTAKTDADKAASRAAKMAIIKGLLAQDGLRASTIRASMDHVLSIITSVCEAAKWDDLTMDADLNLSMGGIPFVMLSKSAQFRAQVVMQVALAQLDKSELLIIDGADILGSTGRMGLVNLLQSYGGFRALVAMTVKRDYAEAVAQFFDGTYWIEDGVAECL